MHGVPGFSYVTYFIPGITIKGASYPSPLMVLKVTVPLIVALTVHMTLVDTLGVLGMYGSFGCSTQGPKYIVMKGMCV